MKSNYSKLSRSEINYRFTKIIGHLNSTYNMSENGRDLDDVIMQLAAVEASIRNLKKDMIRHYYTTSMYEAEESQDLKLKKLTKYINHIMK